MRRRRRVTGLLVAALVAALVWWTQGDDLAGEGQRATETPQTSQNEQVSDPVSGLPWIDEGAMPSQARDTLRLIDADGPYPYDEDDSVFGNREGILPDQQQGYYREYTVDTPGLNHRGARRIVTGSSAEFYWTDDHYSSFSRIDRGQG